MAHDTLAKSCYRLRGNEAQVQKNPKEVSHEVRSLDCLYGARSSLSPFLPFMVSRPP